MQRDKGTKLQRGRKKKGKRACRESQGANHRLMPFGGFLFVTVENGDFFRHEKAQNAQKITRNDQKSDFYRRLSGCGLSNDYLGQTLSRNASTITFRLFSYNFHSQDPILLPLEGVLFRCVSAGCSGDN